MKYVVACIVATVIIFFILVWYRQVLDTLDLDDVYEKEDMFEDQTPLYYFPPLVQPPVTQQET